MANFPIPRDFPFSVQDLRTEFDRLLDRAWHVGLNTAPLDGQDWAPYLDVVEESDAYRVRAEIPGVRGEDVEVAILGNTLTIKGTKPAPAQAEAEDRRSLRAECRYGGFCRKYELPSPVREEGVMASCKNGVLEVTIPKTPEVVGRKVKIQSED
ncbi:MAG: Hsp20/alpha crystallin family protein [Dehalococcoidia bacterium]